MGWYQYFLMGGFILLSVVVTLLYTQVKVLESHTQLVLDAWKKAEEATAHISLASKAYEQVLGLKHNVDALEKWAQAVNQHANSQELGSIEEQIQKYVGLGGEDYEEDLNAHGFNTDPAFNPEDTV